MKKIIVSLAIALAVFTGRTYAAGIDPSIPGSVTEEFSRHFGGAKDITWETGRDFYKATFDMHGRTLFAFYAINGNLMGVAHNLSPDGLPAALREELKNSWTGYWITGLVTYRKGSDKTYVMMLENPDRIVVLQATSQSRWTVDKTTEKG